MFVHSVNKLVGGFGRRNTRLFLSRAYASQTQHPVLPLHSLKPRLPFRITKQNGDPETSDVPETNTFFQWEKKEDPHELFEQKTILIVKKQRDPLTTKWLNTIASFLIENFHAQVLVEPEAAHDAPNVQTYDESEQSELNRVVDLVITLGGDGTLLHVASLFSQLPSSSLPPPPVLSFHLGTLGVLMPYDIEDYTTVIGGVMAGNFVVTPRLRLRADIVRQNATPGLPPVHMANYEVLNEITIHRTQHPHATTILCTVNGHSLATVVGDGLIVATPTGSTAYSMWCGGPMLHPALGGMLLTPISPRGIARPALLPEDSVLRLSVSPTGRATASVSFDGSPGSHLDRGDAVRVRRSPHPLYTIARTSSTADWVKGNYKIVDQAEANSAWINSFHKTPG